MQILTPSVAPRPRAYVRVAGPDAADFLQRMVSNDVEALAEGGSCEAMLLTARGRVLALMRVWRRGADDFLLLTEPELGDPVRAQLVRMRLASHCEIEPEEHRSTLVLGGVSGIENGDYGIPAVEVLDDEVEGTPVGGEELERLRILACTPRHGPEIDERVLPAEAGLDVRAVSFSKGCYPGQELVARLHYRGHPNRRLRVLDVAGAAPGAEIRYGDKVVGSVTSAVADVALAYVRTEVPEDAALDVGGLPGRIRP
jgi:folate-binding protein YgfZ